MDRGGLLASLNPCCWCDKAPGQLGVPVLSCCDGLQWIPPHERARAVSLTTSGMYLGSAGAMLFLPALARAVGPASVLRAVGVLGLAWLLLWVAVGREVPHRCAASPLCCLLGTDPTRPSMNCLASSNKVQQTL